MPELFRERVAQALTSEAQLEAELARMSPQAWQSVAELFAVRLPEFDAVLYLPGAEALAGEVARARGISAYQSAAELPPSGGEVVILAAHLTGAEAVCRLAQEARAAGWTVLLVGAAVERTNKGARPQLGELDLPVRALLQVADTPSGLVFERRTADRWAN